MTFFHQFTRTELSNKMIQSHVENGREIGIGRYLSSP